jgi:tetratricopeptide (TPR) repeat protein
MIRAFVGHSFTNDDKMLNYTFLDYLNHIKAMGIGFTWEHAEVAEPRELAEKVKSLIRDKNLFVGICTKKERVIGPNDLEHCWLKRKVLGGHVDKFLWKTSDWIIQEIGLALGREMDLILLVEEGLRLPGGLQGNIEHIEFNRQNPERSFVKILEMIQALMPKALIQESAASTSKSAVHVKDKEEIESDWYEPKPEWNYNCYRVALVNSIKTDNHEAEEKITSAFLKSPECKGPWGSASWEVYSQYVRLVSGKGGTLGKMEQLGKDKPEVDIVQYYLGKAYEIYKDYGKAAHAYLHAAEGTSDSEVRLLYLGDAAIAYCHAGMEHESEDIVVKMKQEAHKSGVGEDILIDALKDMANIHSDMDVYYGLTERLLELHPGDTGTRFELAYKYSQGNEDKLTLFHYLRIPESERGGGTWNNLGVQYDNFKIVASSISSYRKAEQAGETLAMSNIANKFIKAGFLTEAEEICNKAIMIKDYHKNVNEVLARIKDIPEEEIKMEGEIVKDAAPYSDFYKAYGKSLYEADPSNYIGEWKGPKCHLRLKIQGCSFLAEGSYKPPINQLAMSGLGLHSPSLGAAMQPSPSGKYIVKYEGKLRGHSIKAVMTEKADNIETGNVPNILTGILEGRTERTVLMVISASFNEIRVYDKDAPEDQRLYVLRKLGDGE